MLIFHSIGAWREGHVLTSRVESTRKIVPEVEALIDRAWVSAAARPGVHLFDGPMCRLESLSTAPDVLRLVFSDTSYKPFLGTNLANPQLVDRFGSSVMANPVGASPALITVDGFIMMGRRNASVAYYPDRVHPFSGALEPRDGDDVFATVRRELAEEIRFDADDIAEIVCTGIAEDVALRHPELMFAVTSTRTRERIELQFDRTEHHATWAIEARAREVERAVSDDAALTPIARASLLLWGRIAFGEAWFATVAPIVTNQ
jgi:8-oxo-dGTP pyrophosphatase MutT (NUDIX family)